MNTKQWIHSLVLCITGITVTSTIMGLTPMERDGIVANASALPERMSMNIFLVARNPQGDTVVHEYHARMMQSDIQNMLNYQVDKSIIKSLSLNKNLQNITSDKIFTLAVTDSIKNEFNQFFWKFNPTKHEYSIILPSPYIKNIKWHKVSRMKHSTFNPLWKLAYPGMIYYLTAYSNKSWPIRSYSDAKRKWNAPLG